jgi:hypothetical protein
MTDTLDLIEGNLQYCFFRRPKKSQRPQENVEGYVVIAYLPSYPSSKIILGSGECLRLCIDLEEEP